MFDSETDSGTQVGLIVKDLARNVSYITSPVIIVPNP